MHRKCIFWWGAHCGYQLYLSSTIIPIIVSTRAIWCPSSCLFFGVLLQSVPRWYSQSSKIGRGTDNRSTPGSHHFFSVILLLLCFKCHLYMADFISQTWNINWQQVFIVKILYFGDIFQGRWKYLALTGVDVRPICLVSHRATNWHLLVAHEKFY